METEHKLRLAYFTPEYPSVSHTFIRREIQGLETLGFDVQRFALRGGSSLVDEDDLCESSKTQKLLDQQLSKLILQIIQGVFYANFKMFKGFQIAWLMGYKSTRGVMGHMAYLCEALALLCQLKQADVEHVHVHFGTNAATIALLVKALGGPPFSLTIHGPLEFDNPIGTRLGLKLREAQFVATITSYCSAQVKRWVSYEHWHKLHIVHCTVDEQWFDAARPINQDSDTIVCVGRLSEQKGQLLLLDSLAAAVAKGFKSRVILIGDGELRPEIEAHIATLGLAGHVELKGWCDASSIRKHVLESRALLIPSFAEGLPVVIMEAMALGRPVLASLISGVPELVKDGVNGWLTIAGDSADLTRAMLEIDSSSTEYLSILGQAGQKIVKERHDQLVESKRLADLFSFYSQPADRT